MTATGPGGHPSLTAVVVEDAPIAREHLKNLLAGIEHIEWVGEAATGVEAVTVIERVRPDVVFMDIEMPGMSGLDVVARLDPCPLVVFTTAWDRHAVTAFELQALDYLLKPFGRKRLAAAVDRALAFHRRGGEDAARRYADARSQAPLRRVYVRSRDQIVPVTLDDVEHVQADGDYVSLWVGARSYLLRIPLTRLTERLRPEQFLRVHRSHCVNLDHVTALKPLSSGRLEVRLASGKVVTSSKARAPEIRRRVRIE